MNILSCRELYIKYDAKAVVKNVSFDLKDGDYLSIIGENGSGKTTLMKSILGLIKPVAGHIEFQGIKQIEIGYLPQQTSIQKDFPASVLEVVLSGCLNRHGFLPFYSSRDKKRAQENLENLGIDQLKRKAYCDLSGGQQQRVLLARALCATEKVLMLDEPVTGLDPAASEELYTLLNKLNSEGIAIIMISHDVKSAVKYGSKILHLKTEPLFFGLASEYGKTDVGSKMLRGETHV
ncbi:MAG: ABC transporter ATP-binding protein [Clostridiales bacterium]|jgi:zinc transport system ATP-binding protein|nr:ABC transporter ATP-binding protein [Clostridiales bacterium]MDR2711649.1 ABC transporter ATP-binding protein [Clostridiales bacterium]